MTAPDLTPAGLDRPHPLRPGDAVAFSRPFLNSLRNRGCDFLARDLVRARGRIIALSPMPVGATARVAWNRPGLPEFASVSELVPAGSIR